jgi:hypothetical protein
MCDNGELQRSVEAGTLAWMRLMSQRMNDVEAQVEILMSMNIPVPNKILNVC